jgi:hypothetical protein
MATGMFRRRSALPFGAFLAVPGVLPLFLGQELWGSYLRLSGEASMELQRLRDVQLRVPNIKGPVSSKRRRSVSTWTARR